MVTILSAGPIEGTIGSDPQTINCMATTTMIVRSDLLSFSWIGPGGSVITNNSRVAIKPTTSVNNTYTSTLQFDYLSDSDGGIYICIVTFFNVNGSNSVVIDPPPTDCEFIAMWENCSYWHL